MNRRPETFASQPPCVSVRGLFRTARKTKTQLCYLYPSIAALDVPPYTGISFRAPDRAAAKG